MNYIKSESNGFIRYSGTITGKLDPKLKNKFIYMDGPRLSVSDKPPGVRALVVTSVYVGGTYEPQKYGVYFGKDEDNLRMFDVTFDKRPAAETAAEVLAFEHGLAHVALLDYKKPDKVRTPEDDPEMAARWYEENNVIRIRHPEENPND